MNLLRKHSGQKIASHNLSAEIRNMRTDMKRLHKAGILASGGSVELSEQQEMLLKCRIAGLEEKRRGSWKYVVFAFLLLSCGMFFSVRDVVVYVLPISLVIVVLCYYYSAKQSDDLKNALAHHCYRAYRGIVQRKKWGQTYGEDAEYYYFLEVKGVNIRVDEQVYEAYSVNDEVLLVIMSWEKRDYLVLVRSFESEIFF